MVGEVRLAIRFRVEARSDHRAINPLPGVRRIRFLSSRVKPRSGACGAL